MKVINVPLMLLWLGLLYNFDRVYTVFLVSSLLFLIRESDVQIN